MPNVGNFPPSNITSTSVQYNGFVLSGPENIRIHWGGIDGLQNPLNWLNHLDIGSIPSGNFSVTITGLIPGSVYHITCSDVSETDWANTTGSPAPTFSTLYEPQMIPNALSGSRLMAHMRSVLVQKYAEPICGTNFVQSISGNVADARSVLTCYSIKNTLVSLDYSKDGSGHPIWTQTWVTNNDDGSLRFSYAAIDPSHPPVTSQFGQSGLIVPTTPLFAGLPFPSQWWIHRKGTWKFDISILIDATAPPVGGGAHYPVTLWALPHRTFSTGGDKQRLFWQDAVLGGTSTKTAFGTFRSCCFWNVYFVLGVDTAAAPNGSHICTFSVQCTRLAP